MAARKIWIDLENTPHVPFFAPIVRELRARGHTVVLTARDAYQTCEMAALHGLELETIGRHYGRRKLWKAMGLGVRTAQLLRYVRRERPHLAISHGSRSQIVACSLSGTTSVMLDDYEHSQGPGFARPTWTILPRALYGTRLAQSAKNVRWYDGLKEDVYARELRVDSGVLAMLGVNEHEIVVTVRPPASEAHYHRADSDVLFTRFMERAVRTEGVKVVLLPRNRRQETEIRTRSPHWFEHGKCVVPNGVVDGLNLLWHSDVIVSGGGTMNREAAALGLPVYSTFRGQIGAIDRALEQEGRLHLVGTTADVDRIPLVRRSKTAPAATERRSALPQILSHLESILSVQLVSRSSRE